MSTTPSSIENLFKQFLEQQQDRAGKPKKQNPKELLYKFATEGRNLYHDRNNETYLEVIDNKGTLSESTYLIPIESDQFDRWLISEAHARHNMFLDNSNLVKTIRVLVSGEALKNGTLTEIHNRIGFVNGAIYIDIGSKDRKVIRIDKQGWNVGNYKVFFKRHKEMAELPIPEPGGNIHEIVEFMPPIPKEDRCLVLSWLIASFFSEIERAFLLIEGEHGAGKTTLAKLLKSFIDPAHGEALTYMDSIQNIAQILDHNCIPFIDNVTKISQSVSDLLCTAYSGASYSKRKQYTDDEDFIFNITGNVIFTTIGLKTPKSDFLSRCYKIEPYMEENTYRSKLLFERKFETVKGRIFGAILDCVSKTMSEVEKSAPQAQFRTVDFDHYASCAAEVMGYGKELFWEARQHSESLKDKSIVNATPIISALTDYLKVNNNYYIGRIGTLLAQLPQDLQIKGMIPNKPNVFARRINELRPELTVAGITAIRHANGDNGSRWEFIMSSSNFDQVQLPLNSDEELAQSSVDEHESPVVKNPFLMSENEIETFNNESSSEQDSKHLNEIDHIINDLI